MAGTFALFNTSLFFTNVASAVVISNVSPLWVSIAAWLLLRESLKSQFWIGLLAVLLGVSLIMGGNFVSISHLGIGDIMAMGSSFFLRSLFTHHSMGAKEA